MNSCSFCFPSSFAWPHCGQAAICQLSQAFSHAKCLACTLTDQPTIDPHLHSCRLICGSAIVFLFLSLFNRFVTWSIQLLPWITAWAKAKSVFGSSHTNCFINWFNSFVQRFKSSKVLAVLAKVEGFQWHQLCIVKGGWIQVMLEWLQEGLVLAWRFARRGECTWNSMSLCPDRPLLILANSKWTRIQDDQLNSPFLVASRKHC